MKDTIYRDEAVEICERWRQRAKKLHDRDGWYMADILLRFMKEIPSANRPQGEVDAVEIYERAEHNLEQGYITIGEFDERIKPLRHLCYGKPQGEWIEVNDSLISCKCSICGWESHMHEDDVYGMPYCPNCGAKMVSK